MVMKVLILLAFLQNLFCVVPAVAQPSARVSGIITDETDAAVVGVRIEAIDANGSVTKAVSDNVGKFVFGLSEGIYRLVFEHPGFKRLVLEDVEITNNIPQEFRLNFLSSVDLCPCGVGGVCDEMPQLIETVTPSIIRELMPRNSERPTRLQRTFVDKPFFK